VEWKLTPQSGGTRVRMEHSGFGLQNASAYDAMSGGWRQVVNRLEQVSAASDDRWTEAAAWSRRLAQDRRPDPP
jgi:hypothetical protein